MNLISVFLTPEEKNSLVPGRYYIEVRVKIPTVILSIGEDVPEIPASLDPHNSPHHSHPLVAFAETVSVIFDITGHPACPAEHTIHAADAFLQTHYTELDRAFQRYLRERENEDPPGFYETE